MSKELYIGRYKVIKELGRGGMGIVYQGEDPILDRPVAIKVLPPKKTASKKAVQRFLREARVSARLDHPHIVKVYDIGEEDGLFHIVMEYVPGDSLRDIIEADGKPDIRFMAELFKQLCDAMSYAHEQKITHRDIKPENIKVTDDNKVKVMDFGIAVLDDSHSITETGSVMGTIAYFSPEQARGLEADYRADIYSMGVVFYEMLTKNLPFEAHSLPEMLNKHLYDAPILPTIRNIEVPKEFESLILKCMEKSPDRRFSSALEMENIISDYLSPKPISVFSNPKPQNVENFASDRLAALKAELLAGLNEDSEEPKPSVKHSEELTQLVEEVESERKSAKKQESEKKSDDFSNIDVQPKAVQEEQKEEREKKTSPSEVAPVIPPIPESEPGISEREKYNLFIDKMKKDAEVSQTVSETSVITSSVICPECGQENLASQLCCSRCNASLPSSSGEICDAEYHNRQGMFYFSSGDYEEAIDRFELAIKYDPNYAPPYYNKGRARLEEGNLEQAFKDFSEACELFPDNYESYVYLAEYYRRIENPSEAVRYYLQALKFDQNNLEVRSSLAFLFAQQGEVSQAIKEYSYILAIDPENIDAHKQLAYLYSGLNQVDNAIREFEIVLKYEPENPQIYVWLGDLYKKKRKFGQAEKNYTSAITINPENPEIYTSLSDLYLRQNRSDLAYKTITNALSLEENNREARLQLADMYLRQGDTYGAAAELEHIAASHPGDTEVHQHLGDLYMTMGAYDNAISHYEKSVEAGAGSSSAHAHNKLGMLYLKKDYTQLGILEYRQAVAMQPSNPEYREDLGMAYYCQGDKARAVEELKKAATLDSRNVDYYKAIGVILEEEERYDEAIKMFRKAEELSPRDSLIPALIGKVYFNQGLVSMALIEYKKALSLQPTNYLYHIYIAKAYAKRNQPDLAIESFRMALNLMPSKNRGDYSAVMSKAYVDLARAHIDKGEYTKAKQVLLSAEKLAPDTPSVSHMLGIIAIHEKKGQQAYDYLFDVLKAQPSNVAVLADFARANVLLGEYDTALKTWDVIYELSPGKSDLYNLKIDIYIASGRFSEAVNLIDELMTKDPSNSAYYHSLKAYAANRRKDPLTEERERIAAMKDSSYFWEYTRDYAVFLASRKRKEEAEEYFSEALQNCPENSREELIKLRSALLD